MRNSLLRKLLGRKNQASPHRQPARFRPLLEGLEDRLVPTAGPVQDLTTHMSYATIQAAVNNANPGDTIQVAPGTYQEQVTIGKNNNGVTLNNLKLVGSGPGSTIINGGAAAKPTTYNATIEVDGAKNVTIDGFTIENTSSTYVNNDGNLYGIRIDNGSATIANNHITKIEDSPSGFGVQEGIAVEVGLQGVSTGSATISQNLIDNYQKGGIVVDNTGSHAEIDLNTIVGAGPTGQIAQNGIQVSNGASADVNFNAVLDNIYTGSGTAATGILLDNSGAVTVDHDVLYKNDYGVYVYAPTGTAEVDYNLIYGDTYDGIILDTTVGASVGYNVTYNNGYAGIELYGSTSNNISQNVSKNNGYGIYVDSTSTGNKFTQNQLDGNTYDDAVDQSHGTGTAGTANTWIQNHGKTSSPPGLVS